jgi:hypothetical protein
MKPKSTKEKITTTRTPGLRLGRLMRVASGGLRASPGESRRGDSETDAAPYETVARAGGALGGLSTQESAHCKSFLSDIRHSRAAKAQNERARLGILGNGNRGSRQGTDPESRRGR